MTNYILPCFYSFMACAGFCVMFNLKNIKTAFVACAGGALGWLVYLLRRNIGNDIFQNLAAAMAVAAFSEIMARIFKTPSTVFLIIGILPMVPGGGIYYTMEYCIKGETAMFLEKGLHTFAVAGAIAVGVSLVSSVTRIITSIKKQNLR